MKITFLGTGTSQGVPVIGCGCKVCISADVRDKRLRSSVLVEQGELRVVIDTGPDFRQQMLRCGCSKLNAVLFTHEHRDHISGLDDIRAFNYIQKSPMDVYGEERVMRALNSSFPYVFAEKKYPGIPQVRMHTITTDAFQIGEMEVIPIRMMHYRLPVLGFRLGDFAYLTDGNYIPEAEKEKLFGVKHLVVNALRRETHISHFTLSEAVSLIEELSPRMGYLTHISHQMGVYAELEKELPSRIRSAYDGLVLEL
ncbi:MAG: MBL fold metallo-hydrolase [Bacteroidetes bacterium]|nr:MAG: MBL fold metallo-hydrolase [Bacteroidota bacterium]RLD91345.1 MAG: MBL fold metallo-hydrolase [Bacteroidota bacterium]